jgi:hypothetical protein
MVSTNTLVAPIAAAELLNLAPQSSFFIQGAYSMEHTRSIYSVGTFILVAAMTGCATHNACTGSGCAPDEQTTAAVNAAISAHAELGPPGQIQVSTINHVVYLTGIVDSGYERSIAESVAARTDGVTRVVDSIGLSK